MRVACVTESRIQNLSHSCVCTIHHHIDPHQSQAASMRLLSEIAPASAFITPAIEIAPAWSIQHSTAYIAMSMLLRVCGAQARACVGFSVVSQYWSVATPTRLNERTQGDSLSTLYRTMSSWHTHTLTQTHHTPTHGIGVLEGYVRNIRCHAISWGWFSSGGGSFTLDICGRYT